MSRKETGPGLGNPGTGNTTGEVDKPDHNAGDQRRRPADTASAPLTGHGSARNLHDRGLHVFPVDHPNQPECIGKHGPDTPCDGTRGKHPAVKFGTWAVTVTDKMIDLVWDEYRGLANIGVACGPSNLVVLDGDELGEIERWCAAYGITLPPTYTVTTARGEHRYFFWDHSIQRIGNSPKATKNSGFKIDVRGDGGFVVAEGSRHADGHLYTGNGLPIAALPAKVAALLLAGGHPQLGTELPAQPEPVTALAESVDYNTAKIVFHDRHDGLVAYAGRLRGKGLDLAEAEPVFRARWLCCEQPEGQIPQARYHSPQVPYPVTWGEAQAKLRDVYTRYPAGPNLNGAATATAAGDDDDPGDEEDSIRAFKFPDGHRPTDVGNANRLLQHAGGRIRYVHAWGKWIVYQGGRWIVDEKDALVTETAKQVAKGLYQLAAKTAATEPDEAKLIWAWALKSDTSGHIAAMIRLARGVHGILVNHEHLDADPWLLNVANGTIDLRTGRLRAHNPADLCTLQAPVVFDPHAAAPLWEACVQCWQPDDDVRDYLQVRAGAGATGIPTETVDVDYGHGSNGKSKFHGAIQHVLGPYATVPHKSLLVTGRFEQHATVIADLFRKRVAVASETKAAEALDDEQVKNLTGGDRLKGRRMREDPWEFWPTHTLIMFSNHKPAVRGRDEGIWRRLRLVPWQVTIAEDARDEGLALKLRAEAPGILRWIVDGARRFHQAGARLTPPGAVRAATDQYRRDEDVIGRFIGEVLDIGDPRFDWCYSIDIKNELDAWCAEQDIDPVPSMQEITATLQEMGCKPGGRKQMHGKRSTIWHGVSIAKPGK
jgi:P4 family phage/plasmid primase-like protien